jgi:hypothetical protein
MYLSVMLKDSMTSTESKYQILLNAVRNLADYMYRQNCNLDDVDIDHVEIQRMKGTAGEKLIEQINDWADQLYSIKSHMKLSDKDELSRKVQDYQEVIFKLENDLRIKARDDQALRIRLETSETKLEEIEQARIQLASSSKAIIEEIKKDNQSLIDLLKMKELYIEDLKSQLESHKQVIHTQEEKIAIVPELENEIRELEKKYNQDMNKAMVRHKTEISQTSKELLHQRKIVAANAQYEEKIKQLQQEIESYRRQFRGQVEADIKQKQVLETLAQRNKTVQKLEIECNKFKVKLANKESENEKLRKNVEILKKELESLKSAAKAEEEAEKEYDTNLAMVKHYKRKLEEREKELKEVKARLKRMYHAEIKGKIKEQGFEYERKKFLDKIGDLCKTNHDMETILKKKAVSGITKSDDLDQGNKPKEGIHQANYENMVEIAKSSSEAYRELLDKNKLFSKVHKDVPPTLLVRSVSNFNHRTKSTRPSTSEITTSRSVLKLTSIKTPFYEI